MWEPYEPEPFVLRWMEGRAEALKRTDEMRMPGAGGGLRVGPFWDHCKYESRCRRSPYDRLLNNPVLRADYPGHAAAR